MVILRNQDSNTGAVVGRGVGTGKAPVHLEFAGDGSKVVGKLAEIKIKAGRVELHARKKQVGFFVPVLVVEQDVAIMAKDEIGNRGNDSFAVGAGDEKDGGVMHHKPIIFRATAVKAERRSCMSSSSKGPNISFQTSATILSTWFSASGFSPDCV